MTSLFILPIIFQSLLIIVDEFYFHLRRGLPRWERLGHPLDTLSFLLCFIYTLLFTPTMTHIWIYISLAVLSCLLVTKDEFVHTEHCTAGEHWMHALLFVFHPITLFAVYRFWLSSEYHLFLLVQSFAIFLFMFYQLIFWQFFGKKINAKN